MADEVATERPGPGVNADRMHSTIARREQAVTRLEVRRQAIRWQGAAPRPAAPLSPQSRIPSESPSGGGTCGIRNRVPENRATEPDQIKLADICTYPVGDSRFGRPRHSATPSSPH